MGYSQDEVRKAFIAGEDKNASNYYTENGVIYSYGHHFPLASRISARDGKETVLVNADKSSVTTAKHQSQTIWELQRSYNMRVVQIPISAFLGAINDAEHISGYGYGSYQTKEIFNIELVDFTADTWTEETYTDADGEEQIRNVHKLGAVVFYYKRKYYLSSTDPSHKSGRDGYFLVELPRKCDTVADAYEAIKPRDMPPGAEYVRQGEFFFAPVDLGTRDLKKSAPGRLEKSRDIAQIFTPGSRGNSHTARDMVLVKPGTKKRAPVVYVRGTVKHPEHKRINLGETWHRVYINEARGSWSAVGGVD